MILDAPPLDVGKFGRGDLEIFGERTIAKTLETARTLKHIFKGEKEVQV